MIPSNLSASLVMRDSTSIASLGIPAGPTSPCHKLSLYPGIQAHIRHDAGACQGRRREGLQISVTSAGPGKLVLGSGEICHSGREPLHPRPAAPRTGPFIAA
jgi:hypothetical protein